MLLFVEQASQDIQRVQEAAERTSQVAGVALDETGIELIVNAIKAHENVPDFV